MTADDADRAGEVDSSGDGTDSPGDDASPVTTDAADRIAALEATVAALADRVATLERSLAWVARHQARETGSGVCPKCNAGGALRVERAPTGKKRVRCARCDERFD